MQIIVFKKQRMKKLTLLFLSLLAIGIIFQACDDTKTYAEMLDEEKDAVNAYINTNGIQVISLGDFEKDTVTDVARNEYVGLSNGVYMQVVNRGALDADTFKTNNLVLARFVEVDLLTKDTTLASNVCNPYEIYNIYPDGFRYTESGSTAYGQFLTEAGLGANMLNSYGTAVPSGWLVALKYVRSGAHVKLIVPSKMGHQIAQKSVYPYFYDIREFSIY